MQAKASQNKVSNLERLPQPGDPDRKRVLNVLAQRRYRKRRRDKIAALEAQARRASSTSSQGSATNQVSTPNQAVALPSPPSSENASVSLDHQEFTETISANNELQVQDLVLSPSTFSLSTYPSSTQMFPNAMDTLFSLDDAFDNSILGNNVDMSFFDTTTGFDFPSSFSPSPKADFTDDMNLELPSLKVMKAGMDIAILLGCEKALMNPTYTHVLKPITHISIPNCLQPTAAQQMIPHHPLIDLLPWPSVRTKLICAFAQPFESRPPVVQDEMAIVTLVSDMDDTSEGLRIAGEDGLLEDCWEVGQQFFNNWWWAFEPSIIKRSNILREKRGAARLSLPSPV